MNQQNEQNIVVVYRPETEWQGDIIVQELKDSGIDAYLANRSTANVWGGDIPLSKLEILVPEVQEAKAKEMIDQFLTEHGITPLQNDVLPEGEELKEGEEPNI